LENEMKKHIVSTQDSERYGDRWKPKGGLAYHFENSAYLSKGEIASIFEELLEINNPIYRSCLMSIAEIDTSVLLTEEEKDGLNYTKSGLDDLFYYDIRIDCRTRSHVKVMYAYGKWYKSIYGGELPPMENVEIDHNFDRPFPHTF
jgi:hypothetical protein